ncbi:MAG TPA: FtsQ-type POTRA domain-containing protein [Desulfobulbus sp.]|nr:FtsQ-type POTRA domain-containing protein [Desulfobulbus sp.]
MSLYRSRYGGGPERKKGVIRRLVSGLKNRFVTGRRPAPPPRQATVTHVQREWFFRRISRSMAVLLLLTVLAGTAVWGGWRLLARSEVFRLTGVTVQGNRVVRTSAILGVAGLEQGMNLLTLDTERACRRICTNPWIRSATVRRQWPSTVLVRVREYRPLAILRRTGDAAGGLFYVDRQGEIFAPVRPGQDMDYPVLSSDPGMAPEDRIAEGSPLHEAVRLLLLAARGNPILPVQAISEIHVSRDGSLILYLVDRPFPIYFGREGIRKKFYRLVRILERLYRKDRIDGIRKIDMDYMENRVLVARIAP